MTEGEQFMSSFDNMDDLILNEVVRFSPSAASLTNMNSSEQVRLQQPACRCLVYLLNHQGALVSQNELIACGWGEERSRYITPNAFYQSMHHLRNCLSTAGLGDILYTVSRQGIGVASDVSIRTESASDSRWKIHKLPVLKTAFITITAVLLALVGYGVAVHYHASKSLFDNYIFSSIGKCRTYRSTDKIDESSVSAFIQQANIKCNASTVIFVSRPKYSVRNSILLCSTYTKEKQECRSVIIMGGKS